ncbi:MAG: carotenoid biosynthesis protein [Chloroflexales bacterium]
MNPLFLAFELVMGALFALCLRHAWHQGAHYVWQLIVGVCFGLLLELGTILQLDAYQYGRFALMLGPVPVAIGVGWGVIVYSCRRFSNRTTLPAWARPVLDGLLALSIDLAMDAVAIRLGMWRWGVALELNYFGVPYANFWAWFWVVSSFSAGLHLLADGPGWASRWLGPLGALGVGLAVVLASNRLIIALIPLGLYLPAVAVLLGGALALVLALRPTVRPGGDGWLSLAVGLSFHLYFLGAGLLSGAILQPPVLLVVSLALLGLMRWLHRGDMAALRRR